MRIRGGIMNVRDVEQNVQIGLRVIKSNWADAQVAERKCAKRRQRSNNFRRVAEELKLLLHS